MLQNETKNKSKKIIWLSAIIAILLVTAGLFSFMIKKKIIQNKSGVSSYTIPGVPYFGIYNHIGGAKNIASGYAGGDFCSGVLEVLEYWNPGQNDFRYVCGRLLSGSGDSLSISSDEAINLFGQDGFDAKQEKINLSDLKKYINPQARTPLLFRLPVEADQANSVKSYYAYNLLIGIDDKSQMLTFHSYWLGNNYEISYDDFKKLENNLLEEFQNTYIVVQPKNLQEKLKEVVTRKTNGYPARTEVMKKGEQMFKDYSIGSAGAFRYSFWPEATEYLSKVESSPDFNDYFPPYLKTALYYQMAKMYFLKNDLDKASAYAQKAVAEDHDLNKPFKDWPGYETNDVSPDKSGVIPDPYVVSGDIADKKGDLKGALDNYQKALNMTLSGSLSSQLSASIKNIEIEIVSKGQ